MELVCTQLGRFANVGGRGNAGNLVHLLGTLKKELGRGYKAQADREGKAQFASDDGGKKMRRLHEIIKQSMGSAGPHQLKGATDGHIGKLNASLRHMQVSGSPHPHLICAMPIADPRSAHLPADVAGRGVGSENERGRCHRRSL